MKSSNSYTALVSIFKSLQEKKVLIVDVYTLRVVHNVCTCEVYEEILRIKKLKPVSKTDKKGK